MKKNSKSKTDWVVGCWHSNEQYISVFFIIKKTAKGFHVQAIDESNGEELTVSKLNWDGRFLSFETQTPSNKWRTRNRLEVVSKTKAIHELTFWEPWKKVRLETIAPLLTKKQTRHSNQSTRMPSK